MSLHKQDWLKLLGGGALALTGAGMFGAGPLAGLLGGDLLGGTAAGTAGAATTGGAAAGAEGGSALASSGMFGGPQAFQAMTQGLNVPPIQPGMESAFAKDAVNMAHQAGNLNGLDFLKQRGMADLMNMNQPGEWMARLGRSAGNLAGGAGKMAATNLAMSALSPSSPPPPSAPMMPRQAPSATPAQQPDLQQIVAAAKRGDPQAIAMLRAANIDPTRL